MAKIGGTSGGLPPVPGNSRSGGAPEDPFLGLQHSLLGEDGVPKGHTWGVMSRAATDGIARSWFQDCNTVPLPEWVRVEAGRTYRPVGAPDSSNSAAAEVEALVDHLSWYADGAVVSDLMRDSADLGTFTLLSQSSLGPKIQEFLSGRGVNGEEIPILSMGANIVEVGEPTTWLGPWATSFGTRANIWFDIRTAEDGTESAYFRTNLAISTRVPEKWLAEVFSIPTQAASLLYTAETQLPSSIMTMSRSLSWPNLPEEKIPLPFLTMERNGLCCVNLGNSADGTIQADFAGYPIVLSAGYLIPESSAQHFDDIIPVVIGTLTNLASIIEDGFRNYRNASTPAPFDHLLGSEYVLHDDVEEGVSTGGHSRWVPETHLGDLVRVSRESYMRARPMESGAEQKALLEWIVAEGAGAVVGSAINSLVYSYLLPGREFERAEWLLNKAIAMEILHESPNARANLGQVYLAQGRRDDARQVFTEATTGADTFAVSEASYFLGIMAMEDGNRDQARAHFTTGSQSEADDDGTHRQLCREKLADDFS